MKDELIGGPVESGCGFKTGNVCTVAHLCLSVTSDDPEVEGFWKPISALLFCGQIFKAFIEHSVMKIQSWQSEVSLIPKELTCSWPLLEKKFGAI